MKCQKQQSSDNFHSSGVSNAFLRVFELPGETDVSSGLHVMLEMSDGKTTI